MSEIRTTSATGGQKGVKPQRHDLLPRQALDAIAEVYAFGAGKYADHNWRRGYEWGKSYAALQRHLTAWWDGESVDPESGLSHLGHAGFHVFALLTWLSEQGEGVDNVMDDRWPHGLERARLAAEEAEEAEADAERVARSAERAARQRLAVDGLEPEPVFAGWLAGARPDDLFVIPEGATFGTFEPQTLTLEAHDVPIEALRLMLGLVEDDTIVAHFVVDSAGVVTEREVLLSYGPDLLSKRPAVHPPTDEGFVRRAFDLRDRRGD